MVKQCYYIFQNLCNSIQEFQYYNIFEDSVIALLLGLAVDVVYETMNIPYYHMHTSDNDKPMFNVTLIHASVVCSCHCGDTSADLLMSF